MSEGAALALALLDAEVIDEDDFTRGDDPASFIARSIKRLWLPDGLEDFGLTYTFATVDEQLYFLIALDEGHYLDFAPVAEVCDNVSDQLGPSLLTHLYAHTPLTLAFTPEVCRDLCRHHGFANLGRVCELLGELELLGETFPERSESFYELSDGYKPFAVVVGLQREGVEQDLVDEIFREYEQQVWQGGEYEPLYALEIKATEPGSLNTLKTALGVGKRSLEVTQKLYDTLEVTRCLFP